MGLAIPLKKMLIGRAFTTEKGRIITFGRISWILFPARAMSIMIQDIGSRYGENYLYKLGYITGNDFGNEISEALGLKLKAGKMVQQTILSLTDFTGFGVVKLVKFDIKRNGHHSIKLHIKDNPVVEHSKSLYGSKSMACAFFRGVFSAHTELETYAKKVKLVEKKCICSGAPFCEWESSW